MSLSFLACALHGDMQQRWVLRLNCNSSGYCNTHFVKPPVCMLSLSLLTCVLMVVREAVCGACYAEFCSCVSQSYFR